MVSKENIKSFKYSLQQIENDLNNNVPMEIIKKSVDTLLYNLRHEDSFNEEERSQFSNIDNSASLNNDWDKNFVLNLLSEIKNVVLAAEARK